MRISEFDNVVAREFFARRETLVAEASRVARGLAAIPDGATAPAVAQVDTVRISAEARAVLNALTGRTAGAPPGPDAVMAAIRQVIEGATPENVHEGALRLAGLVSRLRQGAAAPGPQVRGATSFERLAAAAVRALGQAAASPTPVAVARAGGLLRALVGEAQGGGTGMERGALALYLAAARDPVAASVAGNIAARGAEAGQPDGQLPAALHSSAGGRAPVSPGRTRRNRERERRPADGSESENGRGEDGLDREWRGFV